MKINKFYLINIVLVVLGIVIPISIIYFIKTSKFYGEGSNLNLSKIAKFNLKPIVYTNKEIPAAIFNKNANNPNINSVDLKKEIFSFYKKEPASFFLTIKDGKLEGNKNLKISVGDSIIFKNFSEAPISLQSTNNWGFDNLEKDTIFVQEFFVVGKYEYTIFPIGVKGSIEVLEPQIVDGGQ
ncbi:hypothetical protein KA001_01270 [Patescibacteria group bacterium]|nr:hypothetical protein [Patescibacteria group bacterium]